MALKYSPKAFCRTMQNLNGNDKLSGCAVLLQSSDFQQTLAVISRSTFVDKINAYLKKSFLCGRVETLRLANFINGF